MAVPNAEDSKKKLFDWVMLRLGHQMVDVELDPAHLEAALDHAMMIFRQKTQAAYEEAYLFLETEEDKNVYSLPDEVQEVREIFRRGLGSEISGGTTNFDPFELAYTNIYLLQSGGTGGLATYDYYAQYQELAQRMLGGYLNFDYNRVTKNLRIVRNFRSSTTLLLQVYTLSPVQTLLADPGKESWLSRWTLASAREMLGEARSKFATYAGPQGGTTLNGDTLIQQAQAEYELLTQELKDFQAGDSEGYGFRIL